MNIAKFLDDKFEMSKRGSSLFTETSGGVATFLAMSYILAVNPAILSQVGIDKASLITVTALASAVGCFLMALMANLPVALAPAMGANSYFAFAVCLSMGIDWRAALALVFYNGVVFFLISISRIREKIAKSVPVCVRLGLQAGIGLFIAYLGLQYSKIIVADKFTISTVGNLLSGECLLTLVGLLIMAVLISRKFKGAVAVTIALITIVSFWISDSSGKPIATMPESLFSLPNGIGETFMQLDFGYPFREPAKALPVIFVLFIVDLFDTIATLIAMGRSSGLMDKDGNMPNITRAFSADAIATMTGAIFGTSTTGSYVESSAGIEAGARTGFSSIVVGVLFLLTLFFSPIINCVPAIATAPVLIFVGIMMTSAFGELDFSKIYDVVPAIIAMIFVAFSFKISLGFSFGIIAYVVLNVALGNAKNISKLVWCVFAMVLPFLYVFLH